MLPALLLCLAYDGPVKFDLVASLEPLPDDSDYFLERPGNFDVDQDGNYYVVDTDAKVVFAWDKEGNFLRAIGKPGGGPGEFQFSGRGPGGGYVTVHDGLLYIYDSRKRENMLFDTEGNFKKAMELSKIQRARVRNLTVTKDGSYLMHRSRFTEEGGVTEVKLLDKDGKEVTTFQESKNDSFRMRGRRGGGRPTSFTIRAFNPDLVSSFDRQNGRVLIGHSSAPSFDVYDLKGNKKTIKVKLPQKDLTQADKDEYQKLFEGRSRGGRGINIEYPDKKPFFTHLMSVGDKGYLAYTESPHYKNIEGVHIDKNGKLVGRFELECGVGGGFYASNGRTLLVGMNEDDEYDLKELAIRK